MLSVTSIAKKKLTEALQSKTKDPEVAIRIIPSSSTSSRLDLTLDKEKEGDHIVISEEGKKVLLIGPDLVQALEGMIFDYQETPQTTGFTIYKLTSDK